MDQFDGYFPSPRTVLVTAFAGSSNGAPLPKAVVRFAQWATISKVLSVA